MDATSKFISAARALKCHHSQLRHFMARIRIFSRQIYGRVLYARLKIWAPHAHAIAKTTYVRNQKCDKTAWNCNYTTKSLVRAPPEWNNIQSARVIWGPRCLMTLFCQQKTGLCAEWQTSCWLGHVKDIYTEICTYFIDNKITAAVVAESAASSRCWLRFLPNANVWQYSSLWK